MGFDKGYQPTPVGSVDRPVPPTGGWALTPTPKPGANNQATQPESSGGPQKPAPEAIESYALNLKYLGNGDAGTAMGAIEAHAVKVGGALELLAQEFEDGGEIGSQLFNIADALNNVAEAIREHGRPQHAGQER